MIRPTNEIDFGEMLFDWAKAEPHLIAKQAPYFAPYAARAAAGEVLSNGEITLAVTGILISRGQFLAHFLAHRTRWFVASCPVQDIGAINLCRYFERYPDLPGHPNIRTVAELAECDPKNRLDEPFDLAKMRGRPMLVSNTEAGPWCLLEGTHRLVAIHRLVDAGKAPFESFEIVVGICERARDWRMWRPQIAT